jgi:LL-diaminopimelate aminotransferase
VEANNEIYYERLQKLHHVLTELGLEVQEPKGTFFVWAKVPTGTSSQEFANKLLEEAGIIVTPGTAFGQGGEGYIRIALTVPVKRLDEVNNRLRKVMDK